MIVSEWKECRETAENLRSTGEEVERLLNSPDNGNARRVLGICGREMIEAADRFESFLNGLSEEDGE